MYDRPYMSVYVISFKVLKYSTNCVVLYNLYEKICTYISIWERIGDENSLVVFNDEGKKIELCVCLCGLHLVSGSYFYRH